MFGPELFDFLRDLRENNDREWFAANKDRYEAHVKVPMLHFIARLGERLPEVSPHFVADARPQGGSMFRIYRDVRFSKDKSPYKTALAAHFRHRSAGDVHAPGFYLHIEPGNSVGGGGIWHPDPRSLSRIRAAIASDSVEWEAVRAMGVDLEGDSLKRPPAGYAADHPHIGDLKRKDFYAMVSFTEAEVCGPDFVDRYLEACRTVSPLVRFIADTLDLPF